MKAPLIQPYLDAARQGRTGWFHFLIAIVLILINWQVVGVVPLLVILLVSGGITRPETTNIEDLLNNQSLPSFFAVMSTFIVFLFGIWLAVRLVHGRPLRTLVSPDGQINWRRVVQGFAAWFALAAAQALVEALLFPGRYLLNWDPVNFIKFLLPIILLVPIQTSTEELAFRGYLLQGVGLKLRNWLALCLISGIIFALPHISNPEVSENFWLIMTYYFATGVFLALITLKDQRLELALGVHAANNLFTALFANYTVTVLPTPALFTIQTLDATFALVMYALMVVAFYILFFGRSEAPSPLE